MEEKIKVPFWQSVWFVVIMLLLLPPVGIVLVWVSGEFNRNFKIVLTVAAALYTFTVFPLFSKAVADGISTPATANKTVAAETVADDKFVDQRLVGNWMLSSDGYPGNSLFEYFTINFEAGGKYTLDAKVIDNQQIIPMAGTFTVDENGNLFLTQKSGEPITYYYNLVDGIMILQYAENGKVKLKKTESVAVAPAVEPAALVSVELSAGTYVVGADVPPGKYDITAISGTGTFSGRPGIVAEIMGVGSEYYIESYKNATLKAGNEIEITGGLVVNLTSK